MTRFRRDQPFAARVEWGQLPASMVVDARWYDSLDSQVGRIGPEPAGRLASRDALVPVITPPDRRANLPGSYTLKVVRYSGSRPVEVLDTEYVAAGVLAISRIERRRLRGASRSPSCCERARIRGVLLSRRPGHSSQPNSRHRTRQGERGVRRQRRMGGHRPAGHHDLSKPPQPERCNTVIISAYNGVPGTLATYGNPKELPVVVSRHLSDWYWLPDNVTATDALMVDYQPSEVAWMCTSPILVAHLTVPYGVKGLEQGAPVTFCQMKAPLRELWGRLRNFA
jgi:hypothetical protein